MDLSDLPQRLSNLRAWLQSVRQPGGYGGPVSHWWQNRYRYTGPGLDWRYEGILSGYAELVRKTGDADVRDELESAVDDLARRQRGDGHFPGSRFEINPGVLGTPHEAAASLGLLHAAEVLPEPDVAVRAARRNLEALIASLWDGEGFNDRPGVAGRVPNKLATLAQSLLTLAVRTGEEPFLEYGRAAIADVVRYQLTTGPQAGAVHQLGAGGGPGDGRFFPYYNARCIPPLVLAAEVLEDPSLLEAAERILGFIEATGNDDGSWPQIVYQGGALAEWPHWYAGAADLLLGYRALGRDVPERALGRLLESQQESGAFPTAHGFGSQISQRRPPTRQNHRDVTPVAGWIDKTFRLLSALVPTSPLPTPAIAPTTIEVEIEGRVATFTETDEEMRFHGPGNRLLYRWLKREPWARSVHSPFNVY